MPRKNNIPAKWQNKSDTEFKNIIQQSKTWKEVAMALGYKCMTKGCGSIRYRLQSRAQQLNLSIDHLNPGRGNPGKTRKRMSVSQLKSKRRKTQVLRSDLFASGRPNVCAWCKCVNFQWIDNEWWWNGKPITLQIDHIVGRQGYDGDDNLSNLRLLCPNCHSQTENFTGRAQKGIEKKRHKR